MALNEYRLPNGLTYLLDEADAERLGAVPVAGKAAPAPRNKARTPRTKAVKE